MTSTPHEQDKQGPTIAILIHEGMTISDTTGPYEALHFISDAVVKFVPETTGPKRADSGFLTIIADYTLEEVPHPEAVELASGFIQDWVADSTAKYGQHA